MSSEYYSAIDIGTNSFHMIIAEVREQNKFKIVDREREVIRLGSLKDGSISNEETEAAIVILKEFKKICDFYNAPIKAVATSAVRDASNKENFIKEVYSQTGILIEVSEGKREAELIYMGAKESVNVTGKKVICIDIGGGSTEIIYDNLGIVENTESFKLGAVRLSKMFFPHYILSNEAINKCSDHIEATIKESALYRSNPEFDLAIGTAGTIQASASLINYKRFGYGLKVFNNYSFTYDELKDAADLILSCKTKEERLLLGGIEEKRADILPAGMLILQKLFELLNIETMTISSYALREGIILDQLSNAIKA